MKRVFILVLGLSLCSAKPDLKNIVEVLKKVESRGITTAVGDNGKAFGILQIHNIYVQEVNQRYGTNYTHETMFEEECAEEVFFLYMEYANKRFLKKYGRNMTEEEVARCHNGGMYQGHKIEATKKYYKKYLKLKK